MSGLSFHIYRVNPAKEIRGEYKNRYFLLYKLHRGLTPAEINDICISENEKIVIVSSSRGTCHVYLINPEGANLVYNYEIFCRIKLGSMLDALLYPRCYVMISNKLQNKPLQNQFSDLSPCEVVMITNVGILSRYTIEASPVMICTKALGRTKDFKEINAYIPPAVLRKTNENEIEYVDITYNG